MTLGELCRLYFDQIRIMVQEDRLAAVEAPGSCRHLRLELRARCTAGPPPYQRPPNSISLPIDLVLFPNDHHNELHEITSKPLVMLDI